jgi:ABC-type bacteriocin/lantibiotic exporter with double-glycine peptidase domain
MSERQLQKAAKKSIELQQDESDCGVAALLSIIKFYKGYVPLERLRQVSGTTTSGTTMLGLLQAARINGLECEAFEGNIEDLKKLQSPTILHVLKFGIYQHYLVCYGKIHENFIIGDPEEGIYLLPENDLDKIWESKALLTFQPTENLPIGSTELDKIFSLPKSFFDRRKKGDLISRLIDTERVQSSISIVISQDVIDILTLIVSIFFVFFYQPIIALFLVLLVPAYFLIVRNYFAELYRSNKLAMAFFARNESEYIDKLTGIETIKQLNKAQDISENLKSQFKDYQSQVMSAGKVGVNFKVANDYFGLLAVFFVLTYSISSVLENSIQIGDLLAIFAISTISLASTNRIALATAHLQEAQAALDRTYDLISEPSEETTNINLEEIKMINVKKVSFRFAGSSLLLNNVSFTIKKGEIVSIVGENGSGKSTILQLIQKFYPPESGKIMFNNYEISKISNRSIHKRIGVVPQEIKIFNNSIAYNITLESEYDKTKILHFFKLIGLENYFENFSQGMHTILGEEGIKVSGGQKQIIGLARALYKNPDFLLLDEFTSSMDAESERYSLDLINNLKSEKGILIISHEDKISNLANRIYKFSNKKLIQITS